jgi:hypothetical protein
MRLKKLLFVLIYACIKIYAQTVYEPVNSDVYPFLERLFIKGAIEYHSEIKPIPRKDIGEYLLEALQNRETLTKLDIDEIEFYLKDFADEVSFITDTLHFKLPRVEFFTPGQTGRFRFFNYRDSTFTFNLDPILGFEVANMWGSGFTHSWNGLEFYGYIPSGWGYSLDFRDNLETGNNIDRERRNSPLPGINLSKADNNSIQYDIVNAEVNYSWSIGNLSIGKYYLNLGNGKAGQIIMSDKAPSFPLVRLDIKPVKWLSFIYFHGWLKSNIPDSSTYRTTSVEGRESISDISKYIASHMLSFYIAEDISLSIGESVVYSGAVEPIYLIPVMFFRLADHYLSSSGSNTGDNAQVFFDGSYRIQPIDTKIYGSIFIDELSLESVFDGGNLSSVGYTVGFEFSDLVIPNSSLVIEYSRLQPFVYTNSNDAQTYSSHTYQLGHWIGSNADMIYAAYKKGILRGLSLKLSAYYFRKGQTEAPEQQYQSPYPPTLYGDRRNDFNITLSCIWQPIKSAYLTGFYSYSDISDQEVGRTPAFQLGAHNNFGVAAFYGL